MTILHRPLDPATAAEAHRDGLASPFTVTWRQAQALLQTEANHLALSTYDRRHFDVDVYVEVDLPPSAIRLDGGIKANAPRLRSDVVAVTIPTRDHGDLRMVAARYTGSWSRYLPGWQANVYAIAKTLEALRAVDRWGATHGAQYAGFQAIPPTTTGTAMGAGLTPRGASRLLAQAAGLLMGSTEVLDPGEARTAYRIASKTFHPDAGGDPETFRRLTEARDLLAGAS